MGSSSFLPHRSLLGSCLWILGVGHLDAILSPYLKWARKSVLSFRTLSNCLHHKYEKWGEEVVYLIVTC